MDPESDDEFCLKWNNHHSTFMNVLHTLMKKEVLVDVTLAAEGKFIEAHRLVLCTCSEYFQEALSTHANKHAYIFLNNVTYDDLKALVDYMYRGEVNVSQEQLPRFLAAAEALKIKGLSDKSETATVVPEPQPTPPRTKASPNKAVKAPTVPSAPKQARPASSLNNYPTPQTSEPSNTLAESVLTTDDNFIAVNTNDDEMDLGRSEVDGLVTLGKVWSMNQDNVDGDWESTVGLLAAEAENTSAYATRSQSENEYRQYSESLPETTIKIANVEEIDLDPPGTSHTRSRWSVSATGNAARDGDKLPAKAEKKVAKGSVATPPPKVVKKRKATDVLGNDECDTCGRTFKSRPELLRHVHSECCFTAGQFHCPVCDCSVYRAEKLRKHVRTFHKKRIRFVDNHNVPLAAPLLVELI